MLFYTVKTLSEYASHDHVTHDELSLAHCLYQACSYYKMQWQKSRIREKWSPIIESQLQASNKQEVWKAYDRIT